MKETKLLEKINNDFIKVFPNEKITSYISVSENVNNSTIVYYDKNKYFIKHLGIRESENELKEYNNYSDFIWSLLDEIIVAKSINYTSLHKVVGKDFRRVMFAKQIELMYLYSEDFGKRKEQEVNKILESYPYSDNIT